MMNDGARSLAANSPEATPGSAPAPLDAARTLTRWAIALAALGVGVTLFGGTVRSAATVDPRPKLQAYLPSERLAFEPAGRIGRVPASHPAIVPHFVPGLATLAPDVELLLVDTP